MPSPPLPPTISLDGLSPEVLVELYRSMLIVRRTEERIGALYPEQEIRCPTHLSIGQEAAAVGVCAALRTDDIILSGHRCHAHYLAKGGDLRAMMAELYGRVTGCARGKGGSMHLLDPAAGMLGASAIVGGSIPLAVGVALAARMRGRDTVAVAFFGDGATEEGVFHESLAFAGLRRLPVIFACENNFYATYSPLAARQAADNIWERGAATGVPGLRADGNDVVEVYRAARAAVDRARSGSGPTLLELRTYRWRDHVGPGDDVHVGYRARSELDAWMTRDPVRTLADALEAAGVLKAPARAELDAEIGRRIDDAVAFAKASPFPDVAELARGV